MNIFFKMAPVSYEACGVLGGRTVFESGTKFELYDGKTTQNLMKEILTGMIKKVESGYYKYPFSRLAVCFIHLDGVISIMHTADDAPQNTYGYVSNLSKYMQEQNQYTLIGQFFEDNNIQLYNILQQTSETVFSAIGYSTPIDTVKYGHAYDVLRCLDLRGELACRVVERNDSFHKYFKYDMGLNYYLESFENPVDNTREFWLGRLFMTQKYLITSYNLEGNEDLEFEDEGSLVIDQDFADKLCHLTDVHEYLYLDNEHHLKRMVVRMDGDEKLGIWD